MEIWKDIPKFKGYEASNLGRIRVKGGNFISQVLTGKPQYWYVNLYEDYQNKSRENRKLRRVHNLVAQAFLPNPEGKKGVDHIDRNPYNNNLSNLRWATHKENMNNTKHNVRLSSGVLVREYLQGMFGVEYTDNHYRQFIRFRDNCDNTDEALAEYVRWLSLGETFLEKVEYQGELYYREELAKHLNLESYSQFLELLASGWDYEDIRRGFKRFTGNGFTTRDYWFPTRDDLISHFKLTGMHKYYKGVEDGMWLEEALAPQPPAYTVIIDGVEYAGTLKELSETFNKTSSAVETRIRRLGMTLEEALTMKSRRVIKHTTNGETKRNSKWYRHFGIPAKQASNYNYLSNRTFRDTLEHFGIDTSNMEIIACGDVE